MRLRLSQRLLYFYVVKILHRAINNLLDITPSIACDKILPSICMKSPNAESVNEVSCMVLFFLNAYLIAFGICSVFIGIWNSVVM